MNVNQHTCAIRRGGSSNILNKVNLPRKISPIFNLVPVTDTAVLESTIAAIDANNLTHSNITAPYLTSVRLSWRKLTISVGMPE